MSLKRHFWTLIFSALFSVFSGMAQTPKSHFWEAEVDLLLPKKGNWEVAFGAGSRYLFLEEVDGAQVSKNEQQHLELNHFTTYNTSKNAAVSLGFRYRFREIFEKANENEFRIIQQFEYTHLSTFLTPEHRLRFEQRFREAPSFRLRYQFGISQPLNADFSLALSTEFLYSMGKDQKPEMEQRFGLDLENTSFEKIELRLGLEMRREDFTGNPGTEYFLLTAATFQL